MLPHTLCLLHRNLLYGERRKNIVRLKSTGSHHWGEVDLIDRWKALFEVLTVLSGRRHFVRSELPRYHVRRLSHFSCVQLFGTPWTVNCQVLLSVGFSRQGYWSSCSHTFWETNSLRRTMQIVECSLLYRRAQSSLFLAKDPDQHLWKSFIPHVYVSEPTTPNSLRLT